MTIKFSELVNTAVAKRYQTALKWAERRSPEELRHAVATLFARQEAIFGEYTNTSHAARYQRSKAYERGLGYSWRGKVVGTPGAKKKLDNDPIQKAKPLVRAEWDAQVSAEWGAEKPARGFQAKFARDACIRHPEITNPGTVENWAKAWTKERTS